MTDFHLRLADTDARCDVTLARSSELCGSKARNLTAELVGAYLVGGWHETSDRVPGSTCDRCHPSHSPKPGAETEPVVNATPIGSNGSGGNALAASPAQKLWRSPDTVTKPVRLAARKAS